MQLDLRAALDAVDELVGEEVDLVLMAPPPSASEVPCEGVRASGALRTLDTGGVAILTSVWGDPANDRIYYVDACRRSRESYFAVSNWWFGTATRTVGGELRLAGVRGRLLDTRVDVPCLCQVSLSRSPNADECRRKRERLRERQARIGAAISALPESQRIVVLLRDYEELASWEIAEVLGTDASTVSAIHASGMAAIRRLLDDESPDGAKPRP